MTLFFTLMEHWLLFLFYLVMLVGLSGVPNTGMGVHNMFHDDPSLFQDKRRGAVLNSAAIFVQASIAIYVTLVWAFIYCLEFVRTGDVPPDAMDHVVAEATPYILGTSLISLWFGMFPSAKTVGVISQGEKIRCAIGVAIGLCVGFLMLKIAADIAPLLQLRLDLRPSISLLIPAGIVMTLLFLYPRIISGVAMVTLFSVLMMVYVTVNMAPEAYHPLIIIGIFGAIIFFSNLYARVVYKYAPLKFNIPGIGYKNADGKWESHYGRGRRLNIAGIYAEEHLEPETFEGSEDEEATIAPDDTLIQAATGAEMSVTDIESALMDQSSGSRAVSKTGTALMRRDAVKRDPLAIDPIEALEAWKKRVAPKGGKPRMLMVATSGGAYRASFWTAIVLDHLARDAKLSGLLENVRLVTGASGGMVGGAYFTAMMNEDKEEGDGVTGEGQGSILERITQDIYKVQKSSSTVADNSYPYQKNYPLQRDSLSAVAQQMVQRDIPRLFMTGVQKVDRGTVLEDQWWTLNKTFHKIYDHEKAGLKPSIVFSPMLVETGQPLLIGNLDMKAFPATDREERAVFFDWFKDSRETFALKTAVRLNASFPYIAPASALPTEPYRRVVDAGYYDNYGVDLAVSYLSQPQIRNWLIENTSGVMLMQIRAFPFTKPGDEQPGPVARGLQWLTTPMEGIGAARGATMRFRNSQSLRRAESLYFLQAGGGFLQSVVFEVESNTSLSWYMPKRELDDMLGDKGMANDDNQVALRQLRSFWK
ncbi:MAG: hypothetical protein AAGC81_15840 [Pseudomonadota bacterium]